VIERRQSLVSVASPRVTSCKSLSTLATDVAIAYQLESVTHAPAYKVGMCMVDAMAEFPMDVLKSTELPTCLATLDDTYEQREMGILCEKWRVEKNEERAGELLVRARRGRGRGR